MRPLLTAVLLALAPATALAQSEPAPPASPPTNPGSISPPESAQAQPVPNPAPGDPLRAPGDAAPAPGGGAPVPPAPPPPAPAPAPTAVTSDAPVREAPRMAYEEPAAGQLVSGAPLNDPNVAVHVVERKQFRDQGRSELTLYPVAAQANGKFTQHFGTAISYTYHLHENFGIQITPQYNWFTDESAFNRELIVKVREEAQAASSLLLQYGAIGGVEVTPLHGKFAFYDGVLAHYTVVINGGVGAGVTRHQLRPSLEDRPATYGDTGTKMLGSVGGGFRFLIGDRFTLRLEVRDLVYTAKVDRVNGCDLNDLSAISERVTSGNPSLEGVSVGAGCRLDRFEGTDPRTGETRLLDAPLAKALVETPSSDVLNNLGIYAGFSVNF